MNRQTNAKYRLTNRWIDDTVKDGGTKKKYGKGCDTDPDCKFIRTL